MIERDGSVSSASDKIKINPMYRDLHDILCLLYNKKPMALVTLTSLTVPKGVESNILKLAKKSNVKLVRLQNTQGTYRFIFFKESNRKYAEMFLTLSRGTMTPYIYGTLLGYTDSKIYGFYNRIKNSNYDIDRHNYMTNLRYSPTINIHDEKIDDVFNLLS
jgi:hypothetical protein